MSEKLFPFNTLSHTSCADLFFQAAFWPVELQEQSWGDGVGQRAELVARINHDIIQKLWKHKHTMEMGREKEYKCDILHFANLLKPFYIL